MRVTIKLNTPEEIRRNDAEIAQERARFLVRLDKLASIGSVVGKQKLATLNAPWQQWADSNNAEFERY